MRPLDKNNLHEEWIEEIKNRVNSIETELPADGFGAVMNSIRRRKRAKVIKLISYCAAAAIILLLLPTIYINREIVGNFKANGNTDVIAVVKKPSAPYYIVQNSLTEQNTKNAAGNGYITSANNVHYGIDEEVTTNSTTAENIDKKIETTDNSALENRATEKSTSAEKAVTEVALTENTEAESMAMESTVIENSAESNVQKEKSNVDVAKNAVNLTFSDQKEWDKAVAENGRKGRNRKIYREEKGVSIALNAGNAAGGGMFLDSGYYDDIKSLQDMESSPNFLYDINQGVNRVENKDLAKFDKGAFSTTEKNVSHVMGVRENKIDLRGGSYNHKLPLKFGVTVAVKVSKNLYFETGLSYSYLRSDIKKNDEKISQKLHYIGVPVNLNWYFVNGKVAGLYLGAGCNINKCISASIGHESFGIGRFESSLNLQAGFLGKLSRNVGIFVQPGVSFMLSDNEELSKFNNFTVQNYYSDKYFSVTFDAGLRFSF